MKNILIIGTVDTKSDEINFMRKCIKILGCYPVLMDVSVQAAHINYDSKGNAT